MPHRSISTTEPQTADLDAVSLASVGPAPAPSDRPSATDGDGVVWPLDSSEALLAAVPEDDIVARQAAVQQVVHDNLDVARRLAARYRGRGEPQDDLEQVANMGLLLAVLRFDPTHGVSLTDFATPTIIGELRKHFRDRCWTVRPPRRLQELRPELRRVELELEQSLHRAATSAEIADALGLSVAEVAEIERAATGYAPVSLEHPTGIDGSATTLGDSIADDVDDLGELLTRMSVHSLLESLSDRQRRIVELRYFSEMTQQQIADEIGVSQVQVSRLLSQILTKLRRVIEADADLDRPA